MDIRKNPGTSPSAIASKNALCQSYPCKPYPNLFFCVVVSENKIIRRISGHRPNNIVLQQNKWTFSRRSITLGQRTGGNMRG